MRGNQWAISGATNIAGTSTNGRGGRGTKRRFNDSVEDHAARRTEALNKRIRIKHRVEDMLTAEFDLDVDPVADQLRNLIAVMVPLN